MTLSLINLENSYQMVVRIWKLSLSSTWIFLDTKLTVWKVATLIQTSVLSSDRISYIKSLCDVYRPIEIDSNMPLEIKEKHMDEWWRKSDDTLLEEGFYEADLIDYIYRSSHYFRYGLPEFLNKCYEKQHQ